MTIAFALVRAAHFLSLMAVFGGYALRALVEAQLKPAPASRVPEDLYRSAAGISLLTAILWFAFTAVQVSGDPGAIFDGHTLATVATETSFGPFFVARIAACAFLVAATFVPGAARARLLVSGFALGDIAFTGHAASAEVSIFGLGVASDAVHLVTAGFWFGALIELAPLAVALRSESGRLVPLLRLFSRWATPAVALLIAAGALNSVLILYADPARWSATYLTLLAIKIVLAALMVALALANRLSLVPGMETGDAEAGRNLVGSVTAELATGAIIVVIVGFLGLLSPLAM
jgi:putative copper resistance protein D